nr:hypothetical protein [Tanacetum cinerariifolium]
LSAGHGAPLAVSPGRPAGRRWLRSGLRSGAGVRADPAPDQPGWHGRLRSRPRALGDCRGACAAR